MMPFCLSFHFIIPAIVISAKAQLHTPPFWFHLLHIVDKNRLLINHFCFSSIFYETWWSCSTHKCYKFTKFHQKGMKNKKSFLLIARFCLLCRKLEWLQELNQAVRLPGLGKIFVFKFQKRLSNLVWLEITRPRQCILSQKRRVTKFGEGRLNPTLVITLGYTMIWWLVCPLHMTSSNVLRYIHYNICSWITSYENNDVWPKHLPEMKEEKNTLTNAKKEIYIWFMVWYIYELHYMVSCKYFLFRNIKWCMW